ncbi:hypothetical protein PBI_REDNO2_200 [Mycobacterium phage Redno2]|uniref:hypothetical protein n=1 Tax=Mycobacterium phage Redno2 TaxID=1340709 RepID=UPI000387AA5E|nr:hypothetical protein N860_gp208 [Mycobacterium phage Redno2]QDM58025.1 hypothetical protein SEA_NIHILNOMEN_211 [Mycobacterium phage NihilNomen]QZD98080.1 hypothetical protein SEA_BEEM_210 [Mycobacterium phage Beem]UEM46686.1 hypothetical protein SEA_JUICYJAY_203 [Mycobacterium phage JuicyJay]WNM72749.1 hypothetical protein SEA_BOMBITAS_193 [Mycobacterium phage Bombitas]AGS82498.1 hypothetical protein PBI_REDNO2_200 [Mycobacterium phage Redno2]
MSESTRDMLTGYVERAAETVREYARQIESGEYGNVHTVTNGDDDSIEVKGAQDDAEAMTKAFEGGLVGDWDDWSVERNSFDEPTIVDDYGNESPISEWPLSVEVKIGRPLAVVIATGGPHIEIVQDLSNGSAKLAGYWGGEQVYRYGGEFSTVLDYLTGPLYDEAPEEYK